MTSTSRPSGEDLANHAVLLDYCEQHGIAVKRSESTHGSYVQTQWAYHQVLTSEQGSTLRELARGALFSWPNLAYRPGRILRAHLAGGDLKITRALFDSGTLISEPELWAAGDPLRERELAAAVAYHDGLSRARDTGARHDRWRSPTGLPVEVLWRVFLQAAAASAGDVTHPKILQGHPWPGLLGVGALLEATQPSRDGERGFVCVTSRNTLQFSPNAPHWYGVDPTLTLDLTQSQLILEGRPTSTSHLPSQLWVWIHTVVDSTWPILGPHALGGLGGVP